MKTEIEKIIRSDEAARQKVAAAKAKAVAIRAEAVEKAKAVTAENADKLAALKKEELGKIVSAAHSKARLIEEQTERYLEKLHHRRDKQWEALLQNALERIIRA